MGRAGSSHRAWLQISKEELLTELDTAYVGQNALFLDRVGSTNSEARRLAEGGAPEGTLVVADFQTEGRGRLGRRWNAPAGGGLLVSLVFRPNLEPAQVHRLTMVCALAVLDAVELGTGLRADIKWPNDIVLDGAKLCGILAETGFSGSRLQHVIIGIGLNVNLDPNRLGADLLMPATSLSHALGREVRRLPLLRDLLRAVERRYEGLRAGVAPHDEYVERLTTIGRAVKVTAPGEVCSGVAEGVDADGALLVRLPDGALRRIVAGDVTLRS